MTMFKLALNFRPMVLITVGGKIRPKTGGFFTKKGTCQLFFNFSVAKHHTLVKLYIFRIYTTQAIIKSPLSCQISYQPGYSIFFYFFSKFEKITNITYLSSNKITMLDSYVTIFSNLQLLQVCRVITTNSVIQNSLSGVESKNI